MKILKDHNHVLKQSKNEVVWFCRFCPYCESDESVQDKLKRQIYGTTFDKSVVYFINRK